MNNIQWKIFRPSGLKYTEDCERQVVSWQWNETILMNNWQCSLVLRPTRRIGEKRLVPLFTYALSKCTKTSEERNAFSSGWSVHPHQRREQTPRVMPLSLNTMLHTSIYLTRELTTSEGQKFSWWAMPPHSPNRRTMYPLIAYWNPPFQNSRSTTGYRPTINARLLADHTNSVSDTLGWDRFR